ncbi:MAG: hypothetical protein HFK08_04995 [Clostridia bacterium]|jgi:energy-coupling factor transporter ATP-binding protein EcfA2|nr:hypothetical protein [Clostridia bacterium]
MNVVALFGNGQSGKTTVLKLFLAAVLERYKGEVTVVETSSKNLSPSALRKEIDMFEAMKKRGEDCDFHDTYAVLDVGGRRIGITTEGDSEFALRTAMERFSDCDLCFCAARSKGDTLALLRKVTKKGFLIQHRQHQVIGEGVKEIDRRRAHANLSMVQSLLEEL